MATQQPTKVTQFFLDELNSLKGATVIGTGHKPDEGNGVVIGIKMQTRAGRRTIWALADDSQDFKPGTIFLDKQAVSMANIDQLQPFFRGMVLGGNWRMDTGNGQAVGLEIFARGRQTLWFMADAAGELPGDFHIAEQ